MPQHKIPLLMTRPLGANADYAQSFPDGLAARLRFVDCPLIRIVSLGQQLAMAGKTSAIFTSSNGVRFGPPPMARRAYCVGAKTTELARDSGWDAVFAGQTADALVDFLIEKQPEEKLIHFSGVHVRGKVAESLSQAGFSTDRVVLYDQQTLPLSQDATELLRSDETVIVPLFSPRVAEHFASSTPRSTGVQVVALSEAVAQALPEHSGLQAIIAQEPTSAAMFEAIELLLDSHGLG